MRTPVERITHETKPNGCLGRTIFLHSYVATMCKLDGSEVMAVRLDGFERMVDARNQARDDNPDWKLKTINRLYDADFMEEVE